MASKATIFSRVNHARTADEVCAQIESLVLEGVLRVGDKLPGERDLSTQFNVSRPIVREALKQLESRGLLCTRHGGGTFIADVIGDVFSRTMLELIADHPKATDDYLEYRLEVEAIAADYAARRATADDKALLTAIMERMEAAHAKEDFGEEAGLDVEFHQAVCESAMAHERRHGRADRVAGRLTCLRSNAPTGGLDGNTRGHGDDFRNTRPDHRGDWRV